MAGHRSKRKQAGPCARGMHASGGVLRRQRWRDCARGGVYKHDRVSWQAHEQHTRHKGRHAPLLLLRNFSHACG
jgi:hypothetical protein